ncbi:Dam family site-specific DNA-(adenine-N6)-methyltransferase [Mesorhizobium sp. VNQ89]|uniref:DNA adenine methylase n=1 Tax=Mesorhizobium quangtriensis TaxID=3157709 RepID=UPI0032B83C6A
MSEAHNTKVIPFLKWAGGKRWFADRHTDLLPKSYRRYLEPFLGGGAVYFAIAPNEGIVSDVNADLISTYEVIRDEPTSLASMLLEYHGRHCRDFYYEVRSNKPSDKVELAAWFIYLNRTCWNGLYRVNRYNEFNVPIGTKTDVTLSTDSFAVTSERLQSTVIKCCDFEETIDLAEKDDFIFVDPPYTVKHNMNGFVKYNDKIFSWSDQVRLRDAVVRATRRGALVMVTNANHQSIRELYADIGEHLPIKRASVLAASATFRANVEELAIRTWLG